MKICLLGHSDFHKKRIIRQFNIGKINQIKEGSVCVCVCAPPPAQTVVQTHAVLGLVYTFRTTC